MYFNELLTPGAAGAKDINEAGDFLRVLASPAEDVSLTIYKQGREVGTVSNVGAGYSEEIEFDKVRVSSTGGGTVAIVTRMGAKVMYDKAVGSVSLAGTVTSRDENGAFTQVAVTVNATTTQIAAANPARRYLLIQNKDAGLKINVTVNGSAATVGLGLSVAPGDGSLEFNGRCPTGAINAISAGGANANVIVVEG